MWKDGLHGNPKLQKGNQWARLKLGPRSHLAHTACRQMHGVADYCAMIGGDFLWGEGDRGGYECEDGG